MFYWCYVGIPLVLWSDPLVFRVNFQIATVPGCSDVPPVFRVPLFRVPVFLVLKYAFSNCFHNKNGS